MKFERKGMGNKAYRHINCIPISALLHGPGSHSNQNTIERKRLNYKIISWVGWNTLENRCSCFVRVECRMPLSMLPQSPIFFRLSSKCQRFCSLSVPEKMDGPTSDWIFHSRIQYTKCRRVCGLSYFRFALIMFSVRNARLLCEVWKYTMSSVCSVQHVDRIRLWQILRLVARDLYSRYYHPWELHFSYRTLCKPCPSGDQRHFYPL